ncbi:MAG: FAD-dependent oxidoreductase [Nitratireductor sp.]|nr:FAD-dependent oxidoreductase [Nitratireductor sp.]
MMLETDLVIIGAGPAGMAAARTAAQSGLAVLLLDEQAAAGGQIYRQVAKAGNARGTMLGADYLAGLALVDGLEHQRITHLRSASVWQIDDGGRVTGSRNGEPFQARGKRLLIATGALERAMPVPGWTLPGVMTAGAAQILLKQSGLICERAILAGSGPLLYLVAAQMIRSGTPPLALVETQSLTDTVSAMRHLPGALRGWHLPAKGLGLLAEIRRAGIRRYRGATSIAIEGDAAARAICFNAGGQEYRIEGSNFLLHHGVVPNTQLARSIGIAHVWNTQQRCFAPQTDNWGRTNIAEVFIAGDGSGIAGAKAAEFSGQLAALEIACDLSAINAGERDFQAAPLRRQLLRENAARPFIERAYPPYGMALTPGDETIICRCEEVTAGDIRRYAKLGCIGPNQAKAFGRAGMGPCQGRYCGLTITELLADANGKSQAETGYFRIRPPVKPVSLRELSALAKTGSAKP